MNTMQTITEVTLFTSLGCPGNTGRNSEGVRQGAVGGKGCGLTAGGRGCGQRRGGGRGHGRGSVCGGGQATTSGRGRDRSTGKSRGGRCAEPSSLP